MTARTIANPYDHHKGTVPLLRPTGRGRLWCFLGVNLVSFAAVNCFWQYLATGRWQNFSFEAYRRDLATPLGKMLLEPLSIFTHPWMIFVIVLLLAVMIFVPLIISVLYRLLIAGVFVAVVGIVGHAPALAVALMLGCVLAARTPLRSDMPFLAMLLGLLPVGAYLYFFGFVGGSSALAMPLQRWALGVSLLGAIVAALLAAAVVLALAGITHFRPGVVWPVLAAMLAGPVVIFYAKVGHDELSYALIANELAAGQAVFEPVSLATWKRTHGAQELDPTAVKTAVDNDLQRSKNRLNSRCRQFLGSYPDSRRAPAVLWIAAQTHNVQIKDQAYRAGLVEYTADYPLTGSAAGWKRLLEEYPASPHAALARWRLGALALRRRDVQRAESLLQAAAEQIEAFVGPDSPALRSDQIGRVFTKDRGIPSRQHYLQAMFDVERLLWLIKRNDLLNDPEAAEAMAAYLRENPYQPDYGYRLGLLVSTYEKTKMGDNLKLAVAQATTDPYTKAEMLIWLAKDERTDAAVEANYELGRLTMRKAEAPALPLVPGMKNPEAYFKLVVAAPANPWAKLARRHMDWMKVTARTRPRE